MKRVLIIGGTGTISTPITKLLAKNPNIKLSVLNRGRRNEVLPANVDFIKADINDFDNVKRTLEHLEFDIVIHFLVWDSFGAQKCVELFGGKIEQFIFISTICVLNHELSCNLNEESLVGNEYSVYAQGKAAAEKAFLDAYQTKNFPITIVRPSQTYSDNRIPLSVKGNGCWSVVSRMLKNKEVIIHGDGQSVWASTHALDFANLFIKIVGEKTTIGEIYHVVNDEAHSWDMIYQHLANLLNVEYKPVYISTDILKHAGKYNLDMTIQGDKRWSNIFDTSKMQRLVISGKPTIDYRKGIEMYLQFMNEHPELKIEEAEFDDWCDRVIEKYEVLKRNMIEEIREA